MWKINLLVQDRCVNNRFICEYMYAAVYAIVFIFAAYGYIRHGYIKVYNKLNNC